MVLGYLVAAAIAMILARYFKDGVSKSGSTLCGLATWFQVSYGIFPLYENEVLVRSRHQYRVIFLFFM